MDIIGAGFLTLLDADTGILKWAMYMAVNGIGIGMPKQLPSTVL